MEARRATTLALKPAILVGLFAMAASVSLATSASTTARADLSIERAETTARKVVRLDTSYRRIATPRGPLVTRRCWRAHAARVRCSLYAVAPNPCALEGRTDGVCAQALWERRWLVQVVRRSGGLRGRILAVSAGPASGESLGG
jgi:hypothetical protein